MEGVGCEGRGDARSVGVCGRECVLGFVCTRVCMLSQA